MPIDGTLAASLQNVTPNRDAIRRADQLLSADGYDFIGYHGTNAQNMRLMVPYAISKARIGSSAGTSSGPGFYVAFKTNLAVDFADVASEDQTGDAGVPILLRVYVEHFSVLQLGTDYIWTRMGGGGLTIGHLADYELVIRPNRFDRLAVIPTDMKIDAELSARVPPASKEVPEAMRASKPSGRSAHGNSGESPF